MLNRFAQLFSCVILCISATAYANTHTVTETIETSVSSVDAGAVRDQFRLKQSAVLKANTRFPVLVEGIESFRDGQYSESITAITLLQSTAVIKKSRYDAQASVYEGVVDVTLDIKGSMQLLDKLKEKKELEKKLEEYLLLVEQSVSISDKLRLIDLQQEQSNIEHDILNLTDLTSTYAIISAKEKAVFEYRDSLLLYYVDNATWSIDRVNKTNKSFIVRVSGPELLAQYNQLRRDYDRDNMPMLHKGGYLCGISSLGMHFMADLLPLPEPNKRHRNMPISAFEFEVVHDDDQVHIDQFKKTFKLSPCY